MEALLIKKPYTLAFSGSPMVFTWAVTPYNADDADNDIKLQVRLLIERTFMSGVYTEEYSKEYLPDALGKISVELQSIIDPFLKFYVPDININQPAVADGQSLRYKVQWLLIKNSNSVGSTETSEELIAIKGGMSYPLFSPVDFFLAMAKEKYFLGFDDTTINTLPGQNNFLYYLMLPFPPDNELPAWVEPVTEGGYSILFYIFGDDGNTYFKINQTFPDFYQIGKIAVIPTGYEANDLGSVLPPGVTPVRYEVIVRQGFVDANMDTYLLDKAHAYYKLDHRKFYNTHELFYYNSNGGFNTVTLLGKVDYEADYEKQNARRIDSSDYFTNGSPAAKSLILKPEETQKSKGATGFMTREEVENLRDLFLSQQCFELKNGKLLPIIINNNNVKLYSNNSSLYSFQLEWSNAYEDMWHTRQSMIEHSAACPNMESFNAVQIASDTLQISYAMRTPYDLAQLELDVDGVVTTEYIRGNSGVFRKKFTDSPEPSMDVTVKMRCICNQYSDPISAGAWSTVEISAVGDYPPVANDDSFYCPPGVTSALQLVGNVLTNDFDPDGEAIECVPETSEATNAGGTISITTAGVVTYTPPNASFSGQDYFDYGIRNVGGSVATATARIYINVGSTANNVYAKISIRNTYDVSTGPPGSETQGRATYGQVWISYFSDPQGTVPVDVTALLLTVNYRITTEDILPTPGTTNEDLSVSGAGTEQMVYNDVITTNIAGRNVPDPIYWIRTFSLRTGSGYIII